MQKLGIIITSNKIKNIPPFIILTDKDNESYGDLPRLYVGMENARKSIPTFSILEKRIDEKTFWTFGKRERRSDHEKDIENFYRYVLERKTKEIKYIFINTNKFTWKCIRKTLNLILSQELKTIYCEKDMMYVYYRNSILGFSLRFLRYSGCNLSHLYKRIKKNPNNVFFKGKFDYNDPIFEITRKKRYLMAYFGSLVKEKTV